MHFEKFCVTIYLYSCAYCTFLRSFAVIFPYFAPIYTLYIIRVLKEHQMPISLQKASFWKRISAHILDAILALILTVGFALGLSAILKYDSHYDKLAAYRQEYEQTYGIDLDIAQEDFDALSEEEQEQYNIASEAWSKDTRILQNNSKIFYLTLLIISLSLLLACLTIYFIIPLFFKHGQTLGKKVFGLAVMRTNCVKASNFVLFVRAILGLYTIEIMVPVLLIILILFGVLGIVGVVTLALLAILEIVVIIVTKTNSSIHDLLSDTVVVDMASQRIFNTEEEMLEYKKQLHAEEVANSTY